MPVPTDFSFQGNARFMIQKRLGAGGFGVVYQVYDRERNSIVALKTLYQADASHLYRFKKEFRALADLVHPNLAALYELFSEQDQWFFTMEMIDGKNFFDYVCLPAATISPAVGARPISDIDPTQSNLLEKVSKPPAAKQTAVSQHCQADLIKLRAVLKQLTAGLVALHQGGKLHRDIKPSNVLVTKEGRVVILDFGLVSDLTDQGVNQVSSEHIAGTPAYMSPEHALGLPISPASDWYSVGVMIYRAMTGKLPFVGNSMEVMLNKQKREATSPAELVLGIPEDLNTLCVDLLRRDPKLRPTGTEIMRFLADQGDPEISSTAINTGSLKSSATPFIGREKELAQLQAAWQQTKQGRGVSIYLKGRSGMGKSTLIRHLLDQLANSESDLLVLSGRCYEQESVPYKALDSIIDLLSKYLKGLSPLEAEAVLPIDVLALARLFPVLNQVDAISRSKRNVLEIGNSVELRRKAFGALRELLARLANKRDLILFIDDLQWGDLDSAQLLSEILRQPDAPRLLFIGSYRSEEADTSQFLKSLFSLQTADPNNQINTITISELSAAEAQRLATTLLGAGNSSTQSTLYQQIAQESGGSPFFIGELAQYALTKAQAESASPEPEMKIDNVISARIAQLPENGQRLLEMIAVSGQPLSRNVAKMAASLDSDDQLWPLLRANHLVRATGNSSYEEIDTYHDRIREAVLANLPDQLLQQYHRRLAITLEEAKVIDAERLAKHFQLAGEAGKASAYTLTAAEQAAEALAFDRAAELFRQTIRLKPISDPNVTTVQIKLGNVLANAGKGAEAAKAYLAATEDSTKHEILELQRRAAEHFLNVGNIDEGLELLNLVMNKLGMRLNKPKLATILSILLGRLKLWFKGLKYQPRNEAELTPEQLMSIDACWTALCTFGAVSAIQAGDFQTQHLLLALEAGEPYRLSRALAFEAANLYFMGHGKREYRIKLLEMAQSLAEQVNNPELLAMINLVKSSAASLEGNWRVCWDLYCLAEKITKEQCLGLHQGFAFRGLDNALVFSLRALFNLGEINKLLEKLPEIVNDAREKDNLFVITRLKTIALYLSDLIADEPAKADQLIKEDSDLSTKRKIQIQHFWRTRAKIEIKLYCLESAAAWQEINQSWSSMSRSLFFRSPAFSTEVLHLQARAALAIASSVSNPAEYLKIAEQNADQIKRRKLEYGNGCAALLQAGVAASAGKIELAINHLITAEKGLTATDMALYAVVARRRRGELLGGENGKELVAAADNWMLNQQIKNPARMADMLAPGKWQK